MFALLLFALVALATAIPLQPRDSSTSPRGYTPAKFGLPDNTMLVNQITLGFLPDFTTTSISAMNAVLPKPMAVVGDYIQVTPSDTSLSTFQDHRADLLSQSNKPVYMATIMPESLSSWDSNQADAVAEAMAGLNAEGLTTWVRFAYEMNGCPAWNAWGCDPDGFKQAWGIMAASLRAKAPQSHMLWSPNIDANGAGNYADYYPGDDTVDLVGLSLYSFGVNQQENTPPAAGFFSQMVSPFYDVYVGPKNKPFIISETAAAYHYDTDTAVAAVGGSSEYNIKTQWLDQLLGSATQQQFPELIAAVWFNFEKNERGQTIDYRALLGNSAVQNAVAALV